MTEAEDEARRRALVARARHRMKVPATVLIGLGVAQTLGGMAVAFYGSRTGVFPIFLVGTLACGPGAIVFGGGLALRKLRGWNLIFAGLLSTIAIAVVIGGTLAFYEVPGVWLVTGPIAVGLGLLIWQARLEEDSEIRAARSLIYPPKPREAVDFQKW